MPDIVKLSRRLMRKQTKLNRAPAWLLTEIAIKKGRELAERYDVDRRLVLTSLYLAHTVFDPIWKGKIQKNHPTLSAAFAKTYLKTWGVPKEEQEIILNAIEAHHGKVPTKSKIAEVVKNAECFKFITIQGSLIYLHELGLRKVSFHEAVGKVIEKMEHKQRLLTLKDCIKEAKRNCADIRNLLRVE